MTAPSPLLTQTADQMREQLAASPESAAALIRDHLVDDLIQFTAGVLIGADGTPALGPLGLSRLADAPRLSLVATRIIGPDTLTHWTFT